MLGRVTHEVPDGDPTTGRHALLTLWEREVAWAPAHPAAYRDVWVEGAHEVTYEAGSWDSPEVELPFEARELIPSWNAETPPGTWLHVEARVASAGVWTPWFTFARWASRDPADGAPIVRTTVPGQELPRGRVDVDTWRSHEGSGFDRWQLRVTALRAHDADAWPDVTLVGAVATAFGPEPVPVSPPGVAAGRELAVPPLSQRLHVDTFPQWDAGGQSWCSPTSTTMLLRYWGVAPDPEDIAWVGPVADADVVHGVRRVFDRAYGGAGNWAFNAAYAASRGLRAYATRLRDLREAEQFIAAGVPLVVSVAFEQHELDGAGYATKGHLLTIVGFTDDGDVVSNDPNSHRIPSNDEVRVVYRRDQFERAWLLPRGGLAYVMHPRDVALPPEPVGEPNWLGA